jgi:DNA (cytosine-5)-methyltransferase 1
MRKFVLETASPFLLHLTHGDRHAPHDIGDPVPTVTGANRGEQALAVPFMIHRSNGERPGQEPRTYDVNAPCGTAVAGGIKQAPVLAFIAKGYSERPTGGWNGGADLRVPLSTTTAQDHNYLVAASAVKFYGTSTGQDLRDPTHTITANDRGGGHIGVMAASLLRYHGEPRPGAGVRGQSPDAPISTLDASNRFALMAASLLRYNGQSVGQHHAEPIGTLDANDRYAHVEYPLAGAPEWNDIIAAKARRVYRFLVEEGIDGPWLDHENQLVRLPAAPELVIYDIGMRMLVPRELFRANGFDDATSSS